MSGRAANTPIDVRSEISDLLDIVELLFKLKVLENKLEFF
jgi:hypothetical protein